MNSYTKRLKTLVLSIITIFVIVGSNSFISVYAYENLKGEDIIDNRIQVKEFISNEYDSIKKEKPDIVSEYKKYIRDLNKLSDDELKKQNYESDQIKAIRTFDGSDIKLRAASARIKATLSRVSYSYSKSANKTTVKIKFTGGWSGTPFWKFSDRVALTIVGSTARFNKKDASMVVVQANGSKIYPSIPYVSMVGIRPLFGIALGYGPNPFAVYKSFTATYTGVAQGRVTVYDYGAAYAHQIRYIEPNISLSLTIPGNIGAGITIVSKETKEWGKCISVN